MRIQHVLKNTRGFAKAAQSALKWRNMRNKAEVEKRLKILTFWKRHGLEATKEAFGTSRATLFRWQQALDTHQGNVSSLDPKSTAPKRRRSRQIPEAIVALIQKERGFDPRIGKEKLAILIKADELGAYSASTVGRILTDLKAQGQLPNQKKLSFYARTGTHHEKKRTRKLKQRSKHHQGALVKADSIVRFQNGIKRYIVTALDTKGKFAFAYAYTNHTSKGTTDFMRLYTTVSPIPTTHLQTDNGSEFQCHFELYLKQNGITHFHTYPRCPKQNAEIERFNRTLSEAFIEQHRTLLAYDLEAFNEKLINWLLWYNTRRPHWTLGLIPPLQYYCDQLSGVESQRLWTSTSSCKHFHNPLGFL